MIVRMLMSDTSLSLHQDASCRKREGSATDKQIHDKRRDISSGESKFNEVTDERLVTLKRVDNDSAQATLGEENEAPLVIWVNRPKSYVNHSYRDWSKVKSSHNYKPVDDIAKMTFVHKVHHMLSTKEYEKSIQWKSHGRAFIVTVPKTLESDVLPLYFGHGRFSSFLRQLSNHGFKYITTGTDRNCHYHELMLRGLPHLCSLFPEPKDARRLKQDPDNEPNFYEISRKHPLPDDPNYCPDEKYVAKYSNVSTESQCVSSTKDEGKKRHVTSSEVANRNTKMRLVAASSSAGDFVSPSAQDSSRQTNEEDLSDHKPAALKAPPSRRYLSQTVDMTTTHTSNQRVARESSGQTAHAVHAASPGSNQSNVQNLIESLNQLPGNIQLQAALAILNQLQHNPQSSDLNQLQRNKQSSEQAGPTQSQAQLLQQLLGNSIPSSAEARQTNLNSEAGRTQIQFQPNTNQSLERLPANNFPASPHYEVMSPLLGITRENAMLQQVQHDILRCLNLIPNSQRPAEETNQQNQQPSHQLQLLLQQTQQQQERQSNVTSRSQIDINTILAVLAAARGQEQQGQLRNS